MLDILKRFYSFLFRKRIVAFIFILVILISPIVGSVQPYFYKLFVDTIPELNFDKLLWILIAYIGVGIIRTLTKMAAFFFGDLLMVDAMTDLKETVFKHIHDLDFAFHTKKSSGSIISAIKRGDGAFWNIHFSIHYRLVDVAVSFIVMMYFFRVLDVRIAIIAFVSLILSMIVAKFFIDANIRTRKVINKKEDEISGLIVDNLFNFETVKLFAKESYEMSRLNKLHKDWKSAAWKYFYSFRGLDLGMGFVINGTLFFLLLVVLRLSVGKDISIGDFVLVVGFTGIFFPKIFELVWGFRDIAKSYSDIERYFGLLDNKIEVKDPVNPVELTNVIGEIEYKNVSFAYEKDTTTTIKSLSLKIRPGQSVAFVGKSGAGKTTMVKLLMRFFDVNNGSITIDDTNIKNLKKTSLRSLMGVVPQEPVLFNNTIGYNIAYGKRKYTKKEIIAASKLANIHDFIESLPKKYRTQVGERGIKLSGGQKQRVAIARMILSDPEVVIFDEATSQLDSESEKLIQSAFWRAAKNKTTIIIAHRLSTVMQADKIVVMDKGKIVETGSHNDLIKIDGGHYQRFWELQKID